MKRAYMIVLMIITMSLLAACQNQPTISNDTSGILEVINSSEIDAMIDNDIAESVAGYAFDLFIEATQAIEEADSLLLNTTMRMTSSESTTGIIDATVSGTVAQVNTNAGEVEMKIALTTTLSDMEIPSVSFFRNGMFYAEVFGQGVKMSMALEDVIQGANADIIEFSRESVLSENITELSGGSQRLSFEVYPSAIQHIVENHFEGAEIGLTISNAEISAYLDVYGSLSRVETSIDFTSDADGQKADVSLWTQVDVVQVGGMLIHFPPHLDDFMEVASPHISVILE